MGRNTLGICMAAPLKYLIITLKVVALNKVSLSETQNAKAVCLHIDSRWEAFSAY